MSAPTRPDPIVAGLQSVLAAQHAAIYSYPQVGVALTQDAEVQRARELEAAHRLTRDDLMAELARRGVTPVVALPSYPPPMAITAATAAQRWALQLETDCAAAYRYLLAASAGRSSAAQLAGIRQRAITGLSTAAQDATGWRLLLTPAAPTVPFPGL